MVRDGLTVGGEKSLRRINQSKRKCDRAGAQVLIWCSAKT